MDAPNDVEGFVDVLILDKIEVILQNSNDVEDQELSKWLKDYYLNEPRPEGQSYFPLKNQYRFRNLDKAYRRARMLSGRAQDDWPFFSQIFKKNHANQFRKYALGEDRITEDVLQSVEPPTMASSSSSQRAPGESQSSTSSGHSDQASSLPHTTPEAHGSSPKLAMQEHAHPDSQESLPGALSKSVQPDDIPTLPSITSEASDPTIGHSAHTPTNCTAALSEPIATNLDRFPPGSNRSALKRKRQGDNASVKKSPASGRQSSRLSKRRKSTTAGTDVETPTPNMSNGRGGNGPELATIKPEPTVPEKRITRQASRKFLPNPTPKAKGKAQDVAKHKKPQAVAEGTQLVDGNPPKGQSANDERGSVSASQSVETIANSQNLGTTPRKSSIASFGNDSALSGMGTTPERSSLHSNISVPETTSSVPAEANATSGNIEFFARVDTDQGSLDVKLSKTFMNDVATLTPQIQKYAQWKQTQSANLDISFDQWLTIFKMNET